MRESAVAAFAKNAGEAAETRLLGEGGYTSLLPNHARRFRPRDPWHAAVSQWARTHPSATIITTDEILTEFLNALAGTGPVGRAYAAATVHDIRNDARVTVLSQNRADFDAALALYEARPDKDYSLTDCRSMLALRSLGISEVLTHDHHFTQEGYRILFP